MTTTPEEICALAVELYERRIRNGERLPMPDTEIVGEAPGFSARTVLVLMRSTRRQTDRRGRPLAANLFLQGAFVGPEGRRYACSPPLMFLGESLPLVAEMFARAMRVELAELNGDTRRVPRQPPPGEPVEKPAPVTQTPTPVTPAAEPYFGFAEDPDAAGFGLESDPTVGGRFTEIP